MGTLIFIDISFSETGNIILHENLLVKIKVNLVNHPFPFCSLLPPKLKYTPLFNSYLNDRPAISNPLRFRMADKAVSWSLNSQNPYPEIKFNGTRQQNII